MYDGFPHSSVGKESACLQCRRPRFDSWVGKISWSFLKLKFIDSVMPSNHLILCRPLLLLPSIFSSIKVFSNELTLHIKWSKY